VSEGSEETWPHAAKSARWQSVKHLMQGHNFPLRSNFENRRDQTSSAKLCGMGAKVTTVAPPSIMSRDEASTSELCPRTPARDAADTDEGVAVSEHSSACKHCLWAHAFLNAFSLFAPLPSCQSVCDARRSGWPTLPWWACDTHQSPSATFNEYDKHWHVRGCDRALARV
jgi:hypothetical protein